MPYLFVYGTLRRGYVGSMSSVLEKGTDFISIGSVAGRLYLVDYYPGLVESDDSSGVIGDLLVMHNPEATLREMDAYEECSEHDPAPHEYRRVLRSVRTESDEEVLAWVYLYTRDVAGLEEIRSGDFLLSLR